MSLKRLRSLFVVGRERELLEPVEDEDLDDEEDDDDDDEEDGLLDEEEDAVTTPRKPKSSRFV